MDIRQNTEVNVVIGPILDGSGAPINDATVADLGLVKAGNDVAFAGGTATFLLANGNYILNCKAGDSDTLGGWCVYNKNSAQAMALCERRVVTQDQYKGTDGVDLQQTDTAISDIHSYTYGLSNANLASQSYIDAAVAAINTSTNNSINNFTPTITNIDNNVSTILAIAQGNLYEARIKRIIKTGPVDQFSVQWFENRVPVDPSRLSAVFITVTDSTGTAVITSQSMAPAGDGFYYVKSPSLGGGESFIVRIDAVVDASTTPVSIFDQDTVGEDAAT